MTAAHEKQPVVLGIVLLVVIVAVATALLALANSATLQQRQDNHAIYEARLLGEVVPAAEYDVAPGMQKLSTLRPELLLDSLVIEEVYPLFREGATSHIIVAVVAPEGYVAPFKLLVGINAAGEISGVRVAEHRETPGLGDKIEHSRSDWIDGFTGLSLTEPDASQWELQRDGGSFDHISGATITSRAALRAVRAALEYTATNNEQLFTD